MMDTSAIQERIGQLCYQFKLPTMGAQSVARFTAAGHGDALSTFLEVLEQEAEDRKHRRINRLRKESRLPSGKTWETPVSTGAGFEHHRMPLALRQQLDQLAQGSFVDRGVNVLAFGLPGTGKTHALCALGHRLVESGRSVLFVPAYRLVQELLAAKRDLALPRQLRKLDNFDFLLLDDLGYLPQGAEESEVLFTLIAERYERRSLGITSNLVFSEWERIFANPMATAAAIDRVVHHSVIMEFDVPSYRTDAAQQAWSDRGGGPANLIDARPAKMLDAGHQRPPTHSPCWPKPHPTGTPSLTTGLTSAPACWRSPAKTSTTPRARPHPPPTGPCGNSWTLSNSKRGKRQTPPKAPDNTPTQARKSPPAPPQPQAHRPNRI